MSIDHVIEQIINEIKDHKRISLFFHEFPDGDALGSVYGFKAYLEVIFPEKDVRIVGIEQVDKGNLKDIFIDTKLSIPATTEFISNSLAIVFDTANKERIYQKSAHLAKKVIKIDHHYNGEKYGEIN
jgi:nanoRNase/pAp phosphatase (c-di-AMP/oligoRNAs hydrolase)